MPPIAGWYDDPRDPQRLRYWDGAAWTEHVRDRVDAPAPAAATPMFPGASQTQQQTWQYGQAPYQPGQQAPGRPSGAVTTPDGDVVTTWVKRFAAWLLDSLFVILASLPLTGYFFFRAFQRVSDAMDEGSYRLFSPPSGVIEWELPAIAIIAAVTLGYQGVCLRRWGATPGKRILGISVRTWERPGQLSWSTIGKRAGFVFGVSAVGLVPLVGVVASIVGVVDYLFPLWDRRRQALHDKVGGTVVIEGARRGSS